MTPDEIDLIEDAYRVELDEATWLDAVARRANGLIGQGAGLVAMAYRLSETGIDVQNYATLDHQAVPHQRVMGRMNAKYLQETFQVWPCVLAAQAGSAETREITRRGLQELFGERVRDILVVNGLSPSGEGVYVGSLVNREMRLTARRRWLLSRVATHLAAGLRLRRRLARIAGEPPEAVLTPAGKVEHAEEPARSVAARAQLHDAVNAMERARGKLRRKDLDGAVSEWKGLIAARWSLIDLMESDGKRYLIARRNDSPVMGFASLSPREKQAIAFASLGHTNKLIAYEMGVAPSTVSVLLHRAARKLGVQSRGALVGLFVTQALTKP